MDIDTQDEEGADLHGDFSAGQGNVAGCGELSREGSGRLWWTGGLQKGKSVGSSVSKKARVIAERENGKGRGQGVPSQTARVHERWRAWSCNFSFRGVR